MKKIAALLTVILVVVLAVFISSAVEVEEEPQKEAQPLVIEPKEPITKGVVTVYLSDGSVQYEVTSDDITVREEDNEYRIIVKLPCDDTTCSCFREEAEN